MLNIDNFLKEVDYALDVLHRRSKSHSTEDLLTDDEKKQSQRVMRVNHGEKFVHKHCIGGKHLQLMIILQKKLSLKCVKRKEST